ncbi:hypothetical protein DID88_004224 [Monilinia fructigena]|uniref:Diphthine--ammonia ligase n=1 Tax=Monilinia fructigena TaxID=38457 RepID=A0A395IS81_9HELO|nr:hypothetical protein DID88_004224 [Monilinia fructigena]
MSESLNVIALVSGGKDSLFSILHCIQNGHKVVALGNLYPSPTQPQTKENNSTYDDENDLNSFMYQTVGHTVIPLYEEALGIPLYRQAITGSAVQTGTSYNHANITSFEAGDPIGKEKDADKDETESLIPLLRRIIDAHPEANALSAGAILSTYQRTRVESVALRLGLIPLSFLWQYPILPPSVQTSLLQDMQAVGLDARIIKVASGGLDESFLWENVASEKGMRRVERAMKKFSIDVEAKDTRIVREGGGSAWLQICDASLTDKEVDKNENGPWQVPELFDQRSSEILLLLGRNGNFHDPSKSSIADGESSVSPEWELKSPNLKGLEDSNILHWTVIAENTSSSISEEAENVVETLKSRLNQASLSATDIVSTTILLRSIEDFTAINKIYATLFPHPNPPSRVTIACGSSHSRPRSHHPTPLPSLGKIPLIPHTMLLPTSSSSLLSPTPPTFHLSTVLSLQHLLRIADATSIKWFTSACIYIPSRQTTEQHSPSTCSKIAYQAWKQIHTSEAQDPDDDDDPRDLWEEKFRYSNMTPLSKEHMTNTVYPDHAILQMESPIIPPFWTAEVESLPRRAKSNGMRIWEFVMALSVS